MEEILILEWSISNMMGGAVALMSEDRFATRKVVKSGIASKKWYRICNNVMFLYVIFFTHETENMRFIPSILMIFSTDWTMPQSITMRKTWAIRPRCACFIQNLHTSTWYWTIIRRHWWCWCRSRAWTCSGWKQSWRMRSGCVINDKL